jgi:modulator of drug activity B
MKNVLILNGHQYYDVVAKGELTAKYIDTATKYLEDKGFSVKTTHMEKGYDKEEESKNLFGLIM